MKCPKCGEELIQVDYPSKDAIAEEMYHAKDTEWAIPPGVPNDSHYPGWLIAKTGAIPAVCGCDKVCPICNDAGCVPDLDRGTKVFVECPCKTMPEVDVEKRNETKAQVLVQVKKDIEQLSDNMGRLWERAGLYEKLPLMYIINHVDDLAMEIAEFADEGDIDEARTV